MSYCRKCGNKLEDGSTFCNKCGNKIEYIPKNKEHDQINELKKETVNTSSMNTEPASIGNSQNKKNNPILPVIISALVLVAVCSGLYFAYTKGLIKIPVISDVISKVSGSREESGADIISNSASTEDKKEKTENEIELKNTEKTENEEESKNIDVTFSEQNYIDFYNANFANKIAMPYFVNLDEDKELEIIVWSQISEADNDSFYIGEEDATLQIFDAKDGDFKKIYEDPKNMRYYLVENEGKYDLMYSTLPNFTYEYEGVEQFFYLNIDGGKVAENEIEKEKYKKSLSGAINIDEILVNGRRRMEAAAIDSINKHDYSDDKFSKLVEKARVNEKVINDATLVNDGDGESLYAVLGLIEPDIKRSHYYLDNDNDYYKDSIAKVWCIDPDLEMHELETIMLCDLTDEYGDGDIVISSYSVFTFGDVEHYFVEVSGVEYGAHHKYGSVNGERKLLDSDYFFIQNKDGVYCESRRSWGDGGIAIEYVEVTFDKDSYKQFRAEEYAFEVDIADIVDECIEDTYEIDSISTGDYEAASVTVEEAGFQSLRIGTNGKYYITVYAKMRDTYYLNNKYDKRIYYTYRKEGDVFVREEIVNQVEKLETSEIDLPVM